MAGCVRYRVAGRVQGVFFRASAQQKAVELGLYGYVRNLPDGSVETLACGEKKALKAMQDWLHEGPPMAEVTEVECEVVEPVEEYREFEVR